MSSGWFAVDDVTSTPLGGPFRNKSTARAECERLKGIQAMGKPDTLEDQRANDEADVDDFDDEDDDNDDDDDDDQGEDEGE